MKNKLWTWKFSLLLAFNVFVALWVVAAMPHYNARTSWTDWDTAGHHCPWWCGYVPFLVNHTWESNQ